MAATEQLVKQLRKTIEHGDDTKKAALELIIWHDHWLNRADFRAACVRTYEDGAVVRWYLAAKWLDTRPVCSSTELAILELCIALGEDRYRFASMGKAHRQAIQSVVGAALGLGELVTIGGTDGG